jgi:predicted transcriptional regulator
MSIALTNRVEQAHERIDALEKANGGNLITELLAELDKKYMIEIQSLKNEIQGLKMRLGKKY